MNPKVRNVEDIIDLLCKLKQVEEWCNWYDYDYDWLNYDCLDNDW